MRKEPKNHRQPWSPAQDKVLRDLARGNTPTRVIALKMERTPDAIRGRASEKGISLHPPNQRPYGTSGKGK